MDFEALGCSGKNRALETHRRRRGRCLVLGLSSGTHTVSGHCLHLPLCVCARASVRAPSQLVPVSLRAGPYPKDSCFLWPSIYKPRPTCSAPVYAGRMLFGATVRYHGDGIFGAWGAHISSPLLHFQGKAWSSQDNLHAPRTPRPYHPMMLGAPSPLLLSPSVSFCLPLSLCFTFSHTYTRAQFKLPLFRHRVCKR